MIGIAVQARVFGPEPQTLAAPVQKSRRRTIDCLVEDLLLVYNSGVRVGPQVMHTAEVDYFGITRKEWLNI